MARKKSFYIPLPDWKDGVLVYYMTSKQAKDKFKETNMYQDSKWELDDMFGGDGAFVDYKSYQPIIWVDSTIEDFPNLMNTISHEALHAVGNIFDRKGVDYDSDNDEPYTYLLGYIVEQMVSTILGKNYGKNKKKFNKNTKRKS